MALAIKGIPRPSEKLNSMKIPFRLSPLDAASIKADPKNAPTQGVQPIENITPNSREDKKPTLTVFILNCRFVLINGIWMTSMKFKPKITTTMPETILTTVLYSLKKLPSAPANAPSDTNTSVKPKTKPMALTTAGFALFSLFCPAKYEM